MAFSVALSSSGILTEKRVPGILLETYADSKSEKVDPSIDWRYLLWRTTGGTRKGACECSRLSCVPSRHCGRSGWGSRLPQRLDQDELDREILFEHPLEDLFSWLCRPGWESCVKFTCDGIPTSIVRLRMLSRWLSAIRSYSRTVADQLHFLQQFLPKLSILVSRPVLFMQLGKGLGVFPFAFLLQRLLTLPPVRRRLSARCAGGLPLPPSAGGSSSDTYPSGAPKSFSIALRSQAAGFLTSSGRSASRNSR